MTNETVLSNVDFVNYGQNVHDHYATKGAGNKIATVLGIIGAIVVIAILWAIFVRRGEIGKNTEKNTDINLGANGEAINGLKHQIAALTAHERADYGKIMFNDGFLFGGNGYERRGGCGCGEHEHRGNCGNKFKEVRTFTPTTDVVTQESFCNCG